MKTNAWIRFCLIALSLVMAVSMFACGNKTNNETTAAPSTPTTEAPTSQPTETPTTQPTEAPTTQPTEAPTTEPTEAPTTEPTEAPTTEPTEAPTTEPTEAPTTEPTEAPTTETTEAPTTETTEPPVEGDFLEFWDKDDLYYEISGPAYYIEQTANGVIYENTFASDAPLQFFAGRPAGGEEGAVATGKFLFMKYRAPAQKISVQFFTATDSANPVWNRCYNANGEEIVNDTEWHLMIIDLSKAITSITPAEDGQYYLQHFRMDIEGSEMVYLEIAYIGITDELTDISDYVKATETAEDVIALCPHVDACAEGAYVDAYSHTTVCTFCGMAAEATAHVTGAKATWNEETGRYETDCTICGGVAAVDWQWVRDYSTYSDGYRFTAITGGGTEHIVQNGTLVMTPRGNTTWGGLSVGAGGEGALGQYYVLKYRVLEVANDAETVQTNIRFNGAAKPIDMIADGEWHFVVIDLAAVYGIAVENGLIAFNGDHWINNYADANLIKYEVAFEACAESLDRLPEEYRPQEDTTEAPTEAPTEEPTEEPTEAPVEYTYEITDLLAQQSANAGGIWNPKEDDGEGNPYWEWVAYTADGTGWVVSSFDLTGKNANGTMQFRYRVQHGSVESVTFRMTSASAGTKDFTVELINDKQWHVATVDISAMGTDVTTLLFPLNIKNTYTDFQWIKFIGAEAEEDTTEEPTEAPTEPPVEEPCEHVAGAELEVYEPLADGSGLEYYATCSACGEKMTRPLSTFGINWDNKIDANEPVVCGNGVGGGWIVITGGVLKYQFVLTNVNDASETTIWEFVVESSNSGVKNHAPAKYGEDRGYASVSFTIANWGDVNGVNFAGDTVKVEVYAISKADPEAAPIYIKEYGPVIANHKAAYGIWNAETQQYDAFCGCDSNMGTDNSATIYKEAEDMTIGGVWSSSQKNETDGDVTYAKISSGNDAGGWCNTYLGLNPTGKVSGNYLVFRYRAPAAVTGGVLTIKTDAAGGYNNAVVVEIVADNEWHIVVVDLTDYGFTAESVISNASRLDLTAWGKGEYIQLDWFRMYDAYDRMPEEYKALIDAPEEDTEAPTEAPTEVVLSVETLGLASQSYAAGTATVEGVDFEFIQMGNYGDGLQMRDKNGNTSSIWNTSAFASAIARIELVYSDSKDVTYSNPDAVIFRFGNEAKGETYTTKLSTTSGEKTYTITPDAETYTFFMLEHDLGYTFYWKSITIVLVDGTVIGG